MTVSDLTAPGKVFIAWRKNEKKEEVKRGTEQREEKKWKKAGEENG